MVKDLRKQQGMLVDISDKPITHRKAFAEAELRFNPKHFKILLKQGSPKGDVWQTAKIAGVMAAKQTPSTIPLCHPLLLEKVQVTFEVLKSKNTVKVFAEVWSFGKTGVEMEALNAVSTASLTIYDMMKWAGQDMVLSGIRLLQKSGGKGGVYRAVSKRKSINSK
ncbi:MAG: cyclic pyranopterin monophosphate synthase MoaC [Candidatus Omnitrophica bacterium]|nr:cyclic pyranopterin monophosphate synthase MoaC [Candidatus Omnitrophota bacterium]